MKKNLQGFTLIELLIVIALLGALAVGLLAALDPFEQLKKGTDTGIRNTVSEIQGAVIRYYAIKTRMPWGNTTITGIAGTGGPFSTYLQSVIDTGELKKDFFNLAEDQLDNIYINASEQNITVCFQPQSKSFRSDNNTKFSETGGTPSGTCPDADSISCYWCVM